MELFKHGQTVRLLGDACWTESQRHSLWVVDLGSYTEAKDWGTRNLNVHRQTDPDCSICVPRERITAATVLDLLIAD